ncbi:MAG: flagellar hook-length control protein FliK [Nitrosomonas sp.]|nr:flagellar hook-length control protein FliK [Nitrosomonas sp.]
MLNPVAPAQIQTQAPHPVKGNEGSSHANKADSGRFDNILAREVAEKEPALAEDRAKKTAPDTNSKRAEPVSAASVEQPDDAGKARVTQTSDETSATDTAISTDSTSHATSESTANQIQVSQALLLENSVNTEVIPPVVSIGNFTPDNKIQSGLIDKVAGAMPDADSAIAIVMQSIQPGVQKDFVQNPVSGGDNDLWQALRAVNFADDTALPVLSSGFQKHLFTRTGEMSLSLQAGADMLQSHNLSGLSDVSQTGEANFLLQTGVDMSQPHSQSGPGSLVQATSATVLQTAATAAPQHVNLDMQMDQPRWSNEFAQKIVWLAHQQHQVAELRLNPAHLGPVEIMLSLSGDNGTQASAQFVSPHLAVREAIEAALPRLREMMAESGIQLGDVMVGAESFQRQEQGERQSHQHAKNAHGVNGFNVQDELNPGLEKQLTLNRHNGIVNTFA